jgi:nickel/cobalt exporter
MDFLLYAAWAFGLGALHVLEPGHGRILVLAYLIGSKGRPRDAVVLGLVTTFTHTFVVIALGVLSTLAAAYFAPEQAERVLGIVASALIIGLGLWMIVTRTRSARKSTGDHGTEQDHDHAPHEHDSDPDHDHALHDHHGHTHAVPTGPLTLPGLIALGVSGGLVPCPEALPVLLAAISQGQFALVLLFSLGMASVLVGIGLVIVKTGAYTQKVSQEARWQRYVPLVSAYLITLLGGVLLWRALGGQGH